FALGFNPHIKRAMRDILFDEKIAGSIHLTPGQAYEEADNGNRSSVHWDMVLIQTEEFGGGEIYFDDELIRKDGRFVPDYLQPLNPENLV
ncbi:MAG: aminopeptidase, partial [Armatimonadota bacterium]